MKVMQIPYSEYVENKDRIETLESYVEKLLKAKTVYLVKTYSEYPIRNPHNGEIEFIDAHCENLFTDNLNLAKIETIKSVKLEREIRGFKQELLESTNELLECKAAIKSFKSKSILKRLYYAIKGDL